LEEIDQAVIQIVIDFQFALFFFVEEHPSRTAKRFDVSGDVLGYVGAITFRRRRLPPIQPIKAFIKALP
jgi:hypothetical protein